jgi:hypothetical protein
MAKLRTLTFEQAERKQARAVQGLRNLGLDDVADEIEDLTPQEYAQRKRIEVTNPRGKGGEYEMPRRPSREEVEAENEELWQKLESVYDDLGELFEEEEEPEGDEPEEE